MILAPSRFGDAYHTGNGTVIMRAKTEIIEGKKHKMLLSLLKFLIKLINQIIRPIAEVAKEKIVDGITDLRDESTRKGMRIVIELRKDVNPDVMLNNLYKYTQLQSSFSINMISLVNGEPKSLGIKAMIYHYVNHQIEVLERKTAFELKKALERKHLLEGLVIALENIDEVIKIIRGSETTEIAREALMENYQLSELQARAILDMTLRRLTGLEIEKVKEENIEVGKRILDYEDILASAERKETIIKESLLEVKDKYNIPIKVVYFIFL